FETGRSGESQGHDSVLSTHSPTSPPFSPLRGMGTPEGHAGRTHPGNTDSVSTLAGSPDASIVTSPGHRPPTLWWAHGCRVRTTTLSPLDTYSNASGRPSRKTSTDDSDVGADDRFWRDRPRTPLEHAIAEANQAWDDYAGDIAPAPEDSGPESGLSSQYEDSDEEQDDVLDIHAEKGPVAPDLEVPEEHEPAVAEDPQGPTPPSQHAPPHSPRQNAAKLSPGGHPSILGARPWNCRHSHCHPASDLLTGESHVHPADPSPPRFWTDSWEPQRRRHPKAGMKV
ncbi:hypothetical protein M5D96_013776, partial [Drosophila gunungcola]